MSPAPATVSTTSTPDTRDNLSPVATTFESLDVEQTKNAFRELDSTLERLAKTVVCTLGQIAPYLASMQALLSQRGKKRKEVLKKAGLPGWSEWVAEYCSKLDCSFRTIQRHIKKKGGSTEHSGSQFEKTQKNNRPKPTPLKLDNRQQAALVKAQVAANDLVSALKAGADWQTLLAEYEKVAVAPAKLDGFLSTLAPEPDWKGVLAQLVGKLEQFGDKLPVPILAELRTLDRLLQRNSTPQIRDGFGSDDSVALSRGYIVEERVAPNDSRVFFAVVQKTSRDVHGTYASRSEAEAVCQSLNTTPVFSIRELRTTDIESQLAGISIATLKRHSVPHELR